ncbi:hypothetical protein V1514DRAFT_318886 [Lipomyces japonicus]|uniref:uncharacterized protein n=1 Tax=Lipomyces japonicus TaxID=56871 RepID=UPI0034CE53E8
MNGLAERYNGIFQEILFKLTTQVEDSANWDLYVPQALFIYRIRRSTFGKSPAELTVGYQPRYFATAEGILPPFGTPALAAMEEDRTLHRDYTMKRRERRRLRNERK